MKYNFILITILVAISPQLYAQLFFDEARIEFERRIHTWPLLDENQFSEEVKKTIPQYKVDYFDLVFKNERSLYKPSSKGGTPASSFDNFPALSNTVFTDWREKKIITQKNVFDKTYLIEDELRHAKWKITNDFREIAGFNCRRATTMILDSVFVVAFYTDKLIMPGGPESINGLPGMVLGLVINRLNTTWYATKVEITTVGDIKAPVSGTKISAVQLSESIKGSLLSNSNEAIFSRRNILF